MGFPFVSFGNLAGGTYTILHTIILKICCLIIDETRISWYDKERANKSFLEEKDDC
jgi:hypothetical protein